MPRVRLLGPPRIVGLPESHPSPRGQKSWALFARVALAERPVSRRQLVDELFTEADDPLGALRWCLADLRRAFAAPDLLRGELLSIPRDGMTVDAWELIEGTLGENEIGGHLLEGVTLRDSPGFDTWLLLTRAHLRARSLEELRRVTLAHLGAEQPQRAIIVAGRAAALEPLDQDAQELFLRSLVAASRPGLAAVHLASCEATFAREGVTVSPALRVAARLVDDRPPGRLRAGVVASSLLRAGSDAIDAGSVDAGIETLRRAADEVALASDDRLQVDVLMRLGAALVHATRGFDGEGAITLHRAMAIARTRGDDLRVAECLRELAFIDVQAGRHTSAERAIQEATAIADVSADGALTAGVLAIAGMNAADQGRHDEAAAKLRHSVDSAREASRPRQEAWSLGVLARSLLLGGDVDGALGASDASIRLCERERWNVFLPWSQSWRANALLELDRDDEATLVAQTAFALACELGDPCWEGMAARSLALLSLKAGDIHSAEEWIDDARSRCNRIQDRYVWVSAYVDLARIQIASVQGSPLVESLTAHLAADAVRFDLPEFAEWAASFRSVAGADR
jgi:DNA-binding SARP family transcriptional activator